MSDHEASSHLDFEALFEAAPDAILAHDLNNCVIFWNRAAERLYGWSSKEILGRSISRIFYLDRSEREEAMDALRNNRIWQQELRQIDRNGEEHLVQVRQQMQRGSDGQPSAIISFNTKISEERASGGAQGIHHVCSSSILAGGMAHELNNALAPIMLSSALLKRSVEGSKALNMVGMIEKCAKKGADLIAHLLAFERGQGGGVDSIGAYQIKQGLQKLNKEWLPEHIQLQVNIDEALWECRGELSEWLCAFKSLMQNACEAMPDGGKLTVDVGNRFVDENFDSSVPEPLAGAYICIAFTDCGVGIEREALAHVAEPFYTTKVPRQGFGFGLSNTQAMIKGHQGFMRIESERMVGTTVSLFLPANARIVLPDDESASSSQRKIGRGELILVADDEMAMRETLRKVLEDRGYQVVVAQDGSEALAAYASRSSDFDLVVTNLEMPYMDGLALCRALKKFNPDVKILVSTGNMQAESVLAMQSCGVEDFLVKPYTDDRLVDRVHASLES
jgi:PAS domain S-box-containing protein